MEPASEPVVRFANRAATTAAERQRNTANGKKTQLSKKSSGIKTEWVCATVLDKHGNIRQPGEGEVMCSYNAVYYDARKDDGSWNRSSKSQLDHTNCTGTANPTASELAKLATTHSLLAANRKEPAKKMTEAWLGADGLEVHRHMAYRVQQELNRNDSVSFASDHQKLRPYLAALEAKNPGTRTAMRVGADDKLQGMFYTIGAVADVAMKCCVHVLAMDAAAMKHEKYSGQALVLEGLDGDGKIHILAIAQVPKENEAWYVWFLQQCIASGLGPFIKESDMAIISDRHKGMPGALREVIPLVYSANCTKHLITNMCAANIGFQAGPQTWAVWELQKADSRAAYTAQRAVLATLNPKAVDYLDNVGPETWCMFAIDTAGFKMHGMRTSNIVEAENARLLGARSMAPIAFLDETVRLEMKALSAARQQAAKYVHNGQLLTGKAAKHDKMVTGQSQRCSAQDSDGNVFYITYEGAAEQNRREVNLEQKTCSCRRWQQLLMPCFHAVRAARAAGRLQDTNVWYQHAYGQIYIAKNYLVAMRSDCIKLPQLADLVPDGRTKPAQWERQPGRPRHRRIRSRGCTDGANPPRKRPCSRCQELGHYAKTCPNAPANPLV